MGFVLKGALGLVLATVAYLVVLYYQLSYVPEVPVYPDTWWGKGEPGKEDISIKPFKVDVSKEVRKRRFGTWRVGL